MKNTIIAAAVMALTFFNSAKAEVRVEITRELPDEKQLIIQSFPDEDLFQMWMGMKMEEGCDPYVTEVLIIRDYQPED